MKSSLSLPDLRSRSAIAGCSDVTVTKMGAIEVVKGSCRF